MTQRARQQRREREDDRDGQQEAGAEDLRSEQLDEDVACCLAEIDELLAGQESERDRAVREFRALGEHDLKAQRVWHAQYAHLGLRIYSACCTFTLYDENAHRVIEQR